MKRNPWPYAIILYFVIFIAGIATWITFAVRHDQQLVRSDYYEQELQFQSEIESAARGQNSGATLNYNASSQSLALALPRESSSAKLYFYRPSDSKLDREVALALTDGAQTLDVRSFQPGLWKLRLSWTAKGAEFRYDRSLVL